MSQRTKLPFPGASLDDFKPREANPAEPRGGQGADVRAKVDAHSQFPRREQVEESVQINIRMTPDNAERFKRLCADDRRTYGAMVEILMDAFEQR